MSLTAEGVDLDGLLEVLPLLPEAAGDIVCGKLGGFEGNDLRALLGVFLAIVSCNRGLVGVRLDGLYGGGWITRDYELFAREGSSFLTAVRMGF